MSHTLPPHESVQDPGSSRSGAGETTEDRWSALSAIPTGPRARVSAAVARRLFFRSAERLGITVSTDGSPADLVLHRPEEFFARVGSHGLIGFGESYMTGAWDSADLGGTLTTMCTEVDRLVPAWMQRLRAAYVTRPPRTERNSKRNTRRNISRHYDLSNDLFQLFLDPTLSYSSALFPSDHHTEKALEAGAPRVIEALPPAEGASLGEAQVRKIERMLDEAGVTEGSRVLEVGTGWGELAIRAARRGARVHSVTLSSEQQDLARQRIAEAGLADRVTVELCDYRDVTGTYDAIVSVEMIEAVGHQYWGSYFRTLDRLLAPGGRVSIQAITMPHDRMLATRGTWTWINKYIFPGGFLPSVEAIEKVTAEETSLRLRTRLSFGTHYAETLRQWDTAFTGSHDQVLALGFDETFVRMWHFYLEYSRAGFAARYLDVGQLTFTRETR